MTSAAFTMDGTATYKAVAAGASVALALSDTTGVSTVQWRIAGYSDSDVTTPTITPSGTPSGVTASITMPTPVGEEGYSLLIECKVNLGVDVDGEANSALISTGLLTVLNVNGKAPFALGETMEADAETGVVQRLNEGVGVSGSRSVITPSTLSGATHNYNPAGFSTADVVRISSSAGIDLTGLVGTGAKSPKILCNVGANTITLKNLSGSSDANNQFKFAGAVDVSLIAEKSVLIYYDATTTKWRAVSI